MPESIHYKIEFLHEIDLLRQCLEIQKKAWGFSAEEVLPLRMLIICTKIGGQVLGAVQREGKVIGFVNAIPGFREGSVFLHSQMMGVLPEYQNLGIGKSLKLAQRDEALNRGIDRIEWTFDPFEIRNARFNIELLGAICRRFYVNTYGITSSHLHAGLPTDRLVAEWHLSSARVKSRIGSGPSPVEQSVQVTSVEIPLDIAELRLRNPERALKVQLEFRERIMPVLCQNYFVTGFEIDTIRKKARYNLKKLSEHALRQ
jgi:predicted GNAT superfamily acetyltransferase